MADTPLIGFEKNWDRFLTHLTAQIHKRSAKQLPGVNILNMILRDCALDWASPETPYGRWLMGYAAQEPEKAALIRQILMEDMQLKPVRVKNGAALCQTCIPTASAAAGFTASRLLDTSITVQAISTVSAAAVSVPFVLLAGKKLRKRSQEKALQMYLSQLELYHLSIQSILS